MDGRGPVGRGEWSAGGAQLAALEPPPDVDDVEGVGVEEEVVDEDELSFDVDDELSLDEEAPSDALALLRLSVR